MQKGCRRVGSQRAARSEFTPLPNPPVLSGVRPPVCCPRIATASHVQTFGNARVVALR